MSPAEPRYRPGDLVHVPFGFLRGERLGGTVLVLASRFEGGELDMADVRWPDGAETTEHFCDLAPGAQPAPPPESWGSALCRRLRGR